jgi:hypothetical protein
MSDLIFASEEEALQHLSNITGKKIKIAFDKKTKIEVGKSYKVDSYKTNKSHIVTVNDVDLNEKMWYDDHQDGGWWSKGSVSATDDNGTEIYESLEYAEDLWEEV